MLKRTLALLISANFVACASAGVSRPQVAAVPDSALMADYVQRLPIGSRIRVERSNAGSLKGTLMHVTASTIVIQKDTHNPEPPVTIPLSGLTRVTPDGRGHSTALAIWAGIGVAFSSLLVLNLAVLAAM